MTTPTDNLKSNLAALAAQIAAGRSSRPISASKIDRATAGNQAKDNALFLGTEDDKNYLPNIKHFFNGVPTYVCTEPLEYLTQLEIYCAKRGISRVVSTNVKILIALLAKQGNNKTSASLNDYAGSLFTLGSIEIVFINPLRQLFTISYGKFIAQRYISKVVAQSSWQEATAFSWELITPINFQSVLAQLSSSYAIAIDIETLRENLRIRCVGYSGVFISPAGVITTKSYVIPLDSTYALTCVRQLNNLPAPKIFQNGKYDCSYLLRYNAAPVNWLWDTAHFMHSWYSELPKDLAFLNAFFLRKVVYWKDLAETNDLFEYYRYNALDTWATANVWIQQILQAPDWAKHNYTLEFPLVYPCLLAEMTGIDRDMEALVKTRDQVDKQEETDLTSLRKMIDVPAFNPGSHLQVKKLMRVLGCEDLAESSDEKHLAKASLRHPLNSKILGKILDIRGNRKLATTYLRTQNDADKKGNGGGKELCSKILYSLNPHGTDTGRLASREHHFWCGLQIQNIPRGFEVKQTLRSSPGFYLAECDLEQAESRDTAHIAGDSNLIKAVSGSRDFHSVNASAFFGVPYESIYDDATGKTKDKKLRDLAKRVNHGANYNMGPGVLVDTMGLDKIWEAKRLLNLSFANPRDIADYLLTTFHKTYPSIKRDYYASVINEIGIRSKLVSRAFHHTEYNLSHYEATEYIEIGDWTRYCFGSPDKNKLDLNSYVAHCPQSLNARTLNEAFLDVFYKIALPNPTTFRLHAQIHDSILFSYTPGSNHPEQVKSCMEIPVTICDVSGNYRTFTVPAALKLGKSDKQTGEFKLATYWSETE